jgi:hypothetical protein
VTLLAAWLHLGDERLLSPRTWGRDWSVLKSLEYQVEAYHDEHGDYPESLAEHEYEVTNSWGHPFHYRRTADGFEIRSYGADNRPGGQGQNLDLIVPAARPQPVPISLWRFLLQTPLSGRLFAVASLAGFLGGALWHAAQAPAGRASLRGPLISMAATIVLAVTVAIFLAWVHLALEQASGH